MNETLSWGDDSLSAFFQKVQHNEYANSINFPAIYSLLQQLHATFLKVEEVIENDNREELLLPRFLVIRVRSSILAASRLALSQQTYESSAILRVAIEQAWYALHIATDPAPPVRSKIWLRRNEDDAAKLKCKEEFSVGNVRRTHESLDMSTAKQFHKLYEDMIDSGAHPNQQGVVASMNILESKNKVQYQVGVLTRDPLLLVSSLHMTVAVAVGTLKVFRLIFPKRFELMGLDSEIETLVVRLNTVFKSVFQSLNLAEETLS